MNHVSEEDTDYSDNEGNYEEGEAVKKKKKKYRLVGEDQLRSLFRRCQECGEVIDSSSLTIRSEGSACVVEFDCSNLSCKAGNWKSQERIGKGRSTVFEGNQEISIGAFISGVPIPVRKISAAEKKKKIHYRDWLISRNYSASDSLASALCEG